MLNYVRKLIRRSIISSGLLDDSENDFRVQEVQYLGKTAKTECVFPYGMSANLANDAIGVMFAINANSENRVGIYDDPSSRPRDLIQNEVVFYHPKTGSKIHFKNNGDIDVTAIGSTINVIGDIVVTGNYTQTGNINLTGNIAVTGNIDATGTITGTTDVVGGGISLKTHTHNYSIPDHTSAVGPTATPN